MSIKRSDLRVLVTMLSPDYLIPLAESKGRGCPIRGAEEAWAEVRASCREYIRFVRWRDQIKAKDLELALLFRALGWVQKHQHVVSLPKSSWRSTAAALWNDSNSHITGEINVLVGLTSQSVVDRVAIIAVSQALEKMPAVNRAFLQGKCWQRTTPEVMINFELRGEVRSVIFDPSHRDIAWVDRKLTRAVHSARRVQKHELAFLGPQMLQEWSQHGFISSPAGAMLACVGSSGVYKGQSALVSSNGIPIAVTVGQVVDGHVWVCFKLDHRCIDGRWAGKLYQEVKKRMGGMLT